MHWLFLLGIIGFAIAHEGFRKVVLWTCGICASLIALGGLIAVAMTH